MCFHTMLESVTMVRFFFIVVSSTKTCRRTSVRVISRASSGKDFPMFLSECRSLMVDFVPLCFERLHVVVFCFNSTVIRSPKSSTASLSNLFRELLWVIQAFWRSVKNLSCFRASPSEVSL